MSVIDDYKPGTVVSIQGSSCTSGTFDPLIISALRSNNVKCYKTLIFSRQWDRKTENIPFSPLWVFCAEAERSCSEIITICKQSLKKYGKFYFIVIDRRSEMSPAPYSDDDVGLLLDMAKELGVMVIFLPHTQDAGLNFDLFTEQLIIFTGWPVLDTTRTLDEVGAEFGVTPERIREIEAKAVNKLRRIMVERINAIEPIAQKRFAELRDHLNKRLNDESDPMTDYEVDVTVVGRAQDGSTLYHSLINMNLFSKDELDMEYITLNHNDFPLDIPPEQREYHSFLYHDLIDHSPQYDQYKDTKVRQIYSIDMEVEIWEQFTQKGTGLAKAIQVAKAHLPAHAVTRAILSNEIVEPKVVISAYMFDGDPDFCIEDPDEKRAGVEDPYEGVIRYYSLHDEGEIPDDIASRVELLFTNIESTLRLSFDVSVDRRIEKNKP